MTAAQQHIVVDGRVFATEAADRGMGRYVDHLAELLVEAGWRVTMLLQTPHIASAYSRRGVETHRLDLDDEPASATVKLNRFLAQCAAAFYVDATPFLPPMRYDVHACPVVAVLYDLIPMRFPTDYFGTAGGYPLDVYVNGLSRIRKADRVIAISETVRTQALRYLGVPRERVAVIEPGVRAEYRAFAIEGPSHAEQGGGIVCIQGAHRSKNFPSAIPFLERLCTATGLDVDVIVPTPTQGTLVESVRNAAVSGVRVATAISERRKFDLQRRARVIAHLSLEEGYGIPLAEALCLYRPVLCLDNAINRELIAGADDPQAAGVLLLDDPSLELDATLHTAAAFVRASDPAAIADARRPILAALSHRQAQSPATLQKVLLGARSQFADWQSRAGVGVVAPTEIGSCGVSDYCHALLRDGSPRHVMLLGPAPREMQLLPHLRLLPVDLLGDVRERVPGLVFNLAVSDSLSRAFDAIAEQSTAADILVVHDAGSYLPGLLFQAAARGDHAPIHDRYLAGESPEVRELSRRWLADPSANGPHVEAQFLEIDRSYRSRWLGQFRGSLVSHHAAFANGTTDSARDILKLLPADSEIRTRTRYAAMPIDTRATPGGLRLASKMRWALGLGRHDLLVCCAGSVVRGKHLDVVARVIARLASGPDAACQPGGIVLLLAGRVLEDSVFSAMHAEFAARGCPSRLVQVVESNETRYDALLLASDVVIAFREQRRIQMSHSYVRALALGRPMITNQGAGFDDADVAAVCRDSELEGDLERQLLRFRDADVRFAAAAASQSRYRERHTVQAFFANAERLQEDRAATRIADMERA
jgi:glycosyltransferase involved in cell wall biosynthesis